jgi:hypothetical protein
MYAKTMPNGVYRLRGPGGHYPEFNEVTFLRIMSETPIEIPIGYKYSTEAAKVGNGGQSQ